MSGDMARKIVERGEPDKAKIRDEGLYEAHQTHYQMAKKQVARMDAEAAAAVEDAPGAETTGGARVDEEAELTKKKNAAAAVGMTGTLLGGSETAKDLKKKLLLGE